MKTVQLTVYRVTAEDAEHIKRLFEADAKLFEGIAGYQSDITMVEDDGQ